MGMGLSQKLGLADHILNMHSNGRARSICLYRNIGLTLYLDKQTIHFYRTLIESDVCVLT